MSLRDLCDDLRSGAQPDFDAWERALMPIVPMMADFATTAQDPIWHAEGDVRVHTRMVLEALYRDDRAMSLPDDDRLGLVLGAMLHDIAKPTTTRWGDVKGQTRLVAPRHAGIGRDYLAGRLVETDLPNHVLATVLKLVGHHCDVVRLVRHDKPTSAYRRLARQCDTRLVYLLEVADIRGRLCNDADEQLEILELFRLGAEEASAFGTQPYEAWLTDIANGLPPEIDVQDAVEFAAWEHEHGLVNDQYGALARCHRLREGYPKLTILCGPSGSGKSTWSAAQRNITVVSMDNLRAEHGKRNDQRQNGRIAQAAKEAAKVGLRAGRHVVWDATCLRRDFRLPIVELGVRYGAHVTIVAFIASAGDLEKRNRTRSHPVPVDVIRRQADRFELPDMAEAHRVIWRDGDGETITTSGPQRDSSTT